MQQEYRENEQKTKGRKILIVSGGSLDLAFAQEFVRQNQFDKVVAVDGGLKPLRELELVPDYVVGDFDSVDPEVLAYYREMPFIVWETHKPEKDETDTELARSCALRIGGTELAFLGATGGRIDHMLGNLDALYACLQSGVYAYLVDRQNKVYLLDGEKTFVRGQLWGKYVSFLPYTEIVRGITLRGFRYLLTDRTIRRGEKVGLCISNELAADSAQITLKDGVLVCVESHD